jgi:hypothetical protein
VRFVRKQAVREKAMNYTNLEGQRRSERGGRNTRQREDTLVQRMRNVENKAVKHGRLAVAALHGSRPKPPRSHNTNGTRPTNKAPI